MVSSLLLKSLGEGHEPHPNRTHTCSPLGIALMIVECCLRFYGLLHQCLCLLNQAWVGVFNEEFQDQYDTVHRLETNKMCAMCMAKFFGQLFYVDALPWMYSPQRRGDKLL